MPIYEYRCLDCGHQFELMQKFSDPPAETCTSCSGSVQKLISRSRVRVVELLARRLPAQNLPKVPQHPQQRSPCVSLGRV
jgi:putative FmdB family regulatory protein